MKKIQLILSSVRPSRIGDQLADWIVSVGSEVEGLSIEIIDLKEWYLPMDDEPLQPKQGGFEQYQQPHTQAFARKIDESDGFVFLLPQYNWGYPASLKNAIDHIYWEWHDKPAVIVSYGSRGGPKAAQQLREVFGGLKIHEVETAVELPLKDAQFDDNRRLVDPATDFAGQRETLLKAIRELADALVKSAAA